MLINCDETGRLKLQEVLSRLCTGLREIVVPLPEESESEHFNDIYEKLEPESLVNEIFAQAYYERPVIQTSADLLPLIVRIYKKLLNDDSATFSMKIVELISLVKEPLAAKQDIDEEDNNNQQG